MDCQECGKATDTATGWRAYLTDDEQEPTYIAVYCPDCARREFNAGRSGHDENAMPGR